jgi:hypothetical protein
MYAPYGTTAGQFEPHALLRGAQRNITPAQMRLVAAYGRVVYVGNAIHLFFGRREMEDYRRELGCVVDYLCGTVVVCSHDDVILTAYRNSRALTYLRHKPKRTYKR